jgi:hypothetical protein
MVRTRVQVGELVVSPHEHKGQRTHGDGAELNRSRLQEILVEHGQGTKQRCLA